MNEIQGVGQIQPSQFFTAEDLAEMFGHVHVGTITRWWKSGYLPTPTKIGRRNLWSNVSDGVPQDGSEIPRPRIAIVTDFSNSYTSQHRLEHMQKFWSTVHNPSHICNY